MRQQVRMCDTSDGVRLALATSGRGPPLVKAANYLTHAVHDWESPVWHHWLRVLSSDHTLIRYDERGCGLSDWDVDDFSMEAWVRDLESVLDCVDLDRFALLGISQGAAVAIAYTRLHPERVSRLVLYGGYVQGRLRRATTSEEVREAELFIESIQLGWGRNNPAFRQLFTSLFLPEGEKHQMDSFNELQRLTTSPENAARFERAFYEIDVADLAPEVNVPTLVLHAVDDAMVPFEQGRQLAGLVDGARFVPLESANHILREEEPAWRVFVDEVKAFLGAEGRTAAGEIDTAALTAREREVLGLIAVGLSNPQIAERLVISPHTLRSHINHLFRKLGVATRAQAIVLAREGGVVSDAGLA